MATGKSFSPRTWIRYWIVGMVVLAPALLIVGIIDRDPGLIFLAVACVVLGVGMVAFWRQRVADNP
jgi:hypothetical protein